MVLKLYKPYACPLAKIVHGLPTSWEPSIATMKFPKPIAAVTWSPCSKFIAISWGALPPTVEILDAVTLTRLTSLEVPMSTQGFPNELIFSPGGHLLTWFGGGLGRYLGTILSWDLQTGVLVSTVSRGKQEVFQIYHSATYSICGIKFGAVFHNDSHDFTICIYNALYGTHIYSHLIKGPISGKIWTYGEQLRFATMTPESVAILEVEFTSAYAPVEVETLSIPDSFYIPDMFLFHPALPWLALVREKRICIWDTQDCKFLLDSTSLSWNKWMTFSPDGHFFACSGFTGESDKPEIYLWKKSHTGYVLHQRLTSKLGVLRPLFSPNGVSIIAFGGSAVQLWHTKDSSTSLPPVSTQDPKARYNSFIVGFSPDETLAAVVRLEDKTITVLDLKSSVPQLTIDTNMEVYGLGVTRGSIIAVSDGKIVTWNLPMGNPTPNLQADITDSIQTVTFSYKPSYLDEPTPTALVSPNLYYIIIVEKVYMGGDSSSLHLYDMSTGQHLGSVPIESNVTPWFTPDGYEVWCGSINSTQTGSTLDEIDRWKIVRSSESDLYKLEHLGSTITQLDRSPWQSPHGYKVTDNWWILNFSGKQLFWLPPYWRSRIGQHVKDRIWSGQFLALLHSQLSEPVILELE